MYFIHNVDENIKNKIHHKYWSPFVGYLYILEKTLFLCHEDFVTRAVHDKQLHIKVKSVLRSRNGVYTPVSDTNQTWHLICMNYHQNKKYSDTTNRY